MIKLQCFSNNSLSALFLSLLRHNNAVYATYYEDNNDNVDGGDDDVYFGWEFHSQHENKGEEKDKTGSQEVWIICHEFPIHVKGLIHVVADCVARQPVQVSVQIVVFVLVQYLE